MRLLALAAAVTLLTTGIAAAPADAQHGRPGWHNGGQHGARHRGRHGPSRRCTWHHNHRRCR